MKSTLCFVIFIALLTALRARGGSGALNATLNAGGSGALEPLIDLDLGFLSTDPPMPWQSDPFLKVPGYAQVQPKEEKFVLGGIVTSEGEPEAVVNGESVVVGDEIGGRIVESIGRNYVILKKDDSLKELVLAPDESRTEKAQADDDGEEEW